MESCTEANIATASDAFPIFNFYVNMFVDGDKSGFSIRIERQRSLTPKSNARSNDWMDASVVCCI